MSELVFVYAVRVVEEKIVLASQLHLHLVDLAMHRSVLIIRHKEVVRRFQIIV